VVTVGGDRAENLEVTETLITAQLPVKRADDTSPNGEFHPIEITFGNFSLRGVFFRYYPDPVISDFAPRTGDLKGGTEVFIEGTDLARGKVPVVTISDVACNVTSASNLLVKCLTGSQESSGTGRVVLSLGEVSTTALEPFSYAEAGGTPAWVIPVVVCISVAVLLGMPLCSLF